MWSEKSLKVQRGLTAGILVGIPLFLNACNPLNGEGIRLYGSNDPAPAAAPAKQQGKPGTKPPASSPNPGHSGSPAPSPSGSPTTTPTTSPSNVSLLPNCKPNIKGKLDPHDKILEAVDATTSQILAKYKTQEDLFKAISDYATQTFQLKPTDSDVREALIAQMQSYAPAQPAAGSDSDTDLSSPDDGLKPISEAFAGYDAAVNFAKDTLNLTDLGEIKKFADSMLTQTGVMPGTALAVYSRAIAFAKDPKKLGLKNQDAAKELLQAVMQLPQEAVPMHALLRFMIDFNMNIVSQVPAKEAYQRATCGSCLSLNVAEFSPIAACAQSAAPAPQPSPSTAPAAAHAAAALVQKPRAR